MTHSRVKYPFALSKVLFVTDFLPASEAAFQSALELCSLSKADLLILNVVEAATNMLPEIEGDSVGFDHPGDTAERSVEALVQVARHAGITCTGATALGIAHAAILKTQEFCDVDLLVMGTRSIHGFQRLVFGSTAEAVLRCATCPVFTVGPQASLHADERNAPRGSVLFATDFESATTEAICCAATFAKIFRLSLHCLHVLPRGTEEGLHSGRITNVIAEALRHLADTLISGIVPPVCAVVRGSEISVAVVEYARLHYAHLIVLGVQRASLAASRVPAHITHRIIAEAPCPVLTMAFPLQESGP